MTPKISETIYSWNLDSNLRVARERARETAVGVRLLQGVPAERRYQCVMGWLEKARKRASALSHLVGRADPTSSDARASTPLPRSLRAPLPIMRRRVRLGALLETAPNA